RTGTIDAAALAETCVASITDRPRSTSSIDVAHTTMSVFVIVLLGVATFWVLHPFLMSIVWATVVAVAGWPLLLRLDASLARGRGTAVTFVTISPRLVVFVPVTLALVTIVKNADEITEDIRAFETVSVPGPPAILQAVPFAGKRLTEQWKQFAALNPDERTAA